MSMSSEDMKKELDRLKTENEALSESLRKRNVITMKVSEKGGVSLYGVGRFPVTLYAEQWRKVLGEKESLLKFIEDNKQKLNWKE